MKSKSKKSRKDEPERECAFTLHTTASPTHGAILLVLLTEAWVLSKKLPDSKYPIHVAVDFDGQRCCGDVRPVDDPSLGGRAIWTNPTACN